MSDKQPLYRPSNHTEGAVFQKQWCQQCARDKHMSEGVPIDDCADDELCDIIFRSMHSVDDPDYPREWIYGEQGPECTAFIPVGEEVKRRCQKTLDMFGSTDTELRAAVNAPLPIDSEGGHCD